MLQYDVYIMQIHPLLAEILTFEKTGRSALLLGGWRPSFPRLTAMTPSFRGNLQTALTLVLIHLSTQGKVRWKGNINPYTMIYYSLSNSVIFIHFSFKQSQTNRG